jgi:molybdopterin-guanine dinucleotide biosynthesis protein B
MNIDKCFGIAGWKNSGKTSLVASLVSEFNRRGLKISTIKHAHHSFDLDTPGTDSFKHRQAGAGEVVLVSANRWAIQHELNDEAEPDFATILSKLTPCDLVLVEGYKKEQIAKLEIRGAETEQDFLWPDDKTIKAIASDEPIEGCSLPVFQRSQIEEIADFILKTCEIEDETD